MNKIYFFVALVIISLTMACSDNKNQGNQGQNTNPSNNQPTTNSQPAPEADNTARNERDRSDQAVTPTDQQENSTDLAVTQKIRQSVIADKTLSTNAKNVKIITENQVVTLRGVVDSNAEKSKVASLAQQVAGVKDVNNQLEVVKQATSNENEK
jgi:osmotically-inducible protein OsmY